MKNGFVTCLLKSDSIRESDERGRKRVERRVREEKGVQSKSGGRGREKVDIFDQSAKNNVL